jgi:hypothetical protein
VFFGAEIQLCFFEDLLILLHIAALFRYFLMCESHSPPEILPETATADSQPSSRPLGGPTPTDPRTAGGRCLTGSAKIQLCFFEDLLILLHIAALFRYFLMCESHFPPEILPETATADSQPSSQQLGRPTPNRSSHCRRTVPDGFRENPALFF